MGPVLSQGLWGIRTWNPVGSFKVLAALEEWQDHMDQQLVNRGDFTRNKEGGVWYQWQHGWRWGLCAGRPEAESLGGLTFTKMYGEREGIPAGRHSRGTLSNSVGNSAWTTWGVVGGELRCQVSVVIQGPLGRILAFTTELVRSKEGCYEGFNVKRAQRSEQIRSLFLDPLGTCSTRMPMQWRCRCAAEERDWSWVEG